VAVVTGGNRGIGLEICKQVASKGVMVVLTARDEKRGAEAVKNLASEGLSNVLFHQLEVGDLSSAARLADFIREKFGKLDILVPPSFHNNNFPFQRQYVTTQHVKDVASELIMNHW
jgi:(+)-neomenthol dehydrogenase